LIRCIRDASPFKMGQGKEEWSIVFSPGLGALTVEQLLEAVAHLSPTEQREFHRRLAARQGQNGSPQDDQDTLIQSARARLPAAAEGRLKRLMARSERGQLTPRELADYKSLAQEAQRIDAARAAALAELAQRRGQSVQTLKAEIDRKGRTNET
jgi:hypothetical protein